MGSAVTTSPRPGARRRAMPARPAATASLRGSAVGSLVLVCGSVIVLAQLAHQLGPALRAAAADPRVVLPFLLGQGSILAALALVSRGQVGRRPKGAVVALWAASTAALWALAPPAGPVSLWWPLQGLFPIGSYLVIGMSSRTRIVATGALMLPLPALLSPARPETLDQLLPVLGAGVSVTTCVIAVGLTVRSLDEVVRASERAARETRAQRLAAADRETESRSAEAAARYVHDRVLHALLALGMDRREASSATVRSLVRELRDTLVESRARSTDEAGAVPLGPLLRDAAPDGLAVQHVGPGRITLPRQVARAVADAVAEALRNVARHAETAQASVTVDRTPTGVEVSVVDEGRGFDVAEARGRAHAQHRRGLSDSIEERMRDVGGSVDIASRPGVGTLVTLSWSVPTSRAAGREWTWEESTIRPLLRLCLVACLVVGVGSAAQVALLWPSYAAPWLAVLCALPAVLAPVAGLRLVDTGMGGRTALLLAAVSLVVVVGSVLAIRPVLQDAAQLGSLPSATLICALFFAFRPLREGLALATANVACALLASVALLDRPGTALPTILTFLVTMQALSLVVWVALTRVGRAAALADEATVRARTESDLARRTRERSRERVAEVSDRVRPLVDGVADGTLDPADPDVRRQARDLERLLREDLSLGDAPCTRAAVRGLRDRGCHVKVLSPGPAPARWVDAPLGDVVHGLASQLEASTGAGAERTVQLTLFDEPDDRVRLSVVVTPPVPVAAEHPARWGLSTHVDAHALQLVGHLSPTGVPRTGDSRRERHLATIEP